MALPNITSKAIRQILFVLITTVIIIFLFRSGLAFGRWLHHIIN